MTSAEPGSSKMAHGQLTRPNEVFELDPATLNRVLVGTWVMAHRVALSRNLYPPRGSNSARANRKTILHCSMDPLNSTDSVPGLNRSSSGSSTRETR